VVFSRLREESPSITQKQVLVPENQDSQKEKNHEIILNGRELTSPFLSRSERHLSASSMRDIQVNEHDGSMQ
jgi:hypothetical protein